MGVAAPAAPTLADQQALVGCGQVADQVTGGSIVDHRAGRDKHDQVGGGFAGLVVGPAAFAILRCITDRMTEGRQRVERWANFENDAPTASAITAIGSAARDKFFTVEMDHAVPAPAGLNKDFCLIYEHTPIITANQAMSR